MDIKVLDTSFNQTGLVDQFESFIWTDRYMDVGDFELKTPVSSTILSKVPLGSFLSIPQSPHIMIVETREIITDPIKGSTLKITGRSLESLLSYRVVLNGQLVMTGNWQSCLWQMLIDNFITADAYRKIPNFGFQTSSDSRITALTIDAQYQVNNYLQIMVEQCQYNSVGFKVVPDINNQMIFSFYMGTDRTYAQSTVPFVVFSPRYDNLASSDYVESLVGKGNVGVVFGEGSGSARRYVAVGIDTVAARTGWNRRERVFEDNISRTIPTGTMTDAQYNSELSNYGYAGLAVVNNNLVKFTGDIAYGNTFLFGKDFFMGDLVQIENEFGMLGVSRVTEVIFSQDASKISTIPTFTAI